MYHSISLHCLKMLVHIFLANCNFHLHRKTMFDEYSNTYYRNWQIYHYEIINMEVSGYVSRPNNACNVHGVPRGEERKTFNDFLIISWRCGQYSNIPVGCSYVTDPKDSCCRVPQCSVTGSTSGQTVSGFNPAGYTGTFTGQGRPQVGSGTYNSTSTNGYSSVLKTWYENVDLLSPRISWTYIYKR